MKDVLTKLAAGAFSVLGHVMYTEGKAGRPTVTGFMSLADKFDDGTLTGKLSTNNLPNETINLADIPRHTRRTLYYLPHGQGIRQAKSAKTLGVERASAYAGGDLPVIRVLFTAPGKGKSLCLMDLVFAGDHKPANALETEFLADWVYKEIKAVENGEYN